MYTLFLLFCILFTVVHTQQLLLSCAEVCTSSVKFNENWSMECNCKNHLSNDKSLFEIEDKGVYYINPVSNIPFPKKYSFSEQLLNLENPISKLLKYYLQIYGNLLKTPVQPSHHHNKKRAKKYKFNKAYYDFDDLQKRKPVYLKDVDINNPSSSTSFAKGDKVASSHLPENAPSECLDFLKLLYMREKNYVKRLKDMWYEENLEKYSNLSNSELINKVYTICSKVVKQSMIGITKFKPKKKNTYMHGDKKYNVRNDKHSVVKQIKVSLTPELQTLTTSSISLSKGRIEVISKDAFKDKRNILKKGEILSNESNSIVDDIANVTILPRPLLEEIETSTSMNSETIIEKDDLSYASEMVIITSTTEAMINGNNITKDNNSYAGSNCRTCTSIKISEHIGTSEKAILKSENIGTEHLIEPIRAKYINANESIPIVDTKEYINDTAYGEVRAYESLRNNDYMNLNSFEDSD